MNAFAGKRNCRSRRPRLILGSADLSSLRRISESLAGRVEFLELGSLSRVEVGRGASSTSHWLRGGYPQSLLAPSEESSARWREALIRSCLERDLPQLGFHVAAPELRWFWTMLAHGHGQNWNAQALASSFGTSPPTATHYRSIFKQMFLLKTVGLDEFIAQVLPKL